ncbi:hypothetical protein TRFO_04815 [Tritrichomonas foetus]|uniref:Uncharacterized protein n=1 Tax=Tritrichomonas foetus TaxID=1144522 RepID=A0A1J4KG23_9EUKA|nr:hypothetical protein TRFO_04815 [Tritrichomonas foetus]|eukprot:OHT08724.1 hypothetical protein TRFO_04815 [Tritrichomonas foetus]
MSFRFSSKPTEELKHLIDTKQLMDDDNSSYNNDLVNIIQNFHCKQENFQDPIFPLIQSHIISEEKENSFISHMKTPVYSYINNLHSKKNSKQMKEDPTLYETTYVQSFMTLFYENSEFDQYLNQADGKFIKNVANEFQLQDNPEFLNDIEEDLKKLKNKYFGYVSDDVDLCSVEEDFTIVEMKSKNLNSKIMEQKHEIFELLVDENEERDDWQYFQETQKDITNSELTYPDIVIPQHGGKEKIEFEESHPIISNIVDGISDQHLIECSESPKSISKHQNDTLKPDNLLSQNTKSMSYDEAMNHLPTIGSNRMENSDFSVVSTPSSSSPLSTMSSASSSEEGKNATSQSNTIMVPCNKENAEKNVESHQDESPPTKPLVKKFTKFIQKTKKESDEPIKTQQEPKKKIQKLIPQKSPKSIPETAKPSTQPLKSNEKPTIKKGFFTKKQNDDIVQNDNIQVQPIPKKIIKKKVVRPKKVTPPKPETAEQTTLTQQLPDFPAFAAFFSGKNT